MLQETVIRDNEIAQSVAKIIVDSDSYVVKYNETWTRLPDGSEVPCYCNCRWLNSSPVFYKPISNYLIEIAEREFGDIQLVAGLATAGITWASFVARSMDLPLCYVRGSKKGYGIGGLIECHPPKGLRTLLIDDTCFTGESLVKAIEALRIEFNEIPVGILTIAALSSYECTENQWDYFKRNNIRLVSLTDHSFILDYCRISGVLSSDQALSMLGYYRNPSTYKFIKKNEKITFHNNK